MTPPPQLWQVLTQQWCPVPAVLAWCWWRAIVKARWSVSVQWREQFLTLARQDAALTWEEVPTFLGELATLPALIGLLEQLRQERVLLAHDARQIEERLLGLADAGGQWKHTPGRRQPA